ncbi:beta-ketoacyl-ACP synthase III [Chloroflexota bacterium]
MAINSTTDPRYAHIIGWGMAVPDRVLSNDDLSAIVDTSDDWIQERTGIRERRIAAEDESTATLGFLAARRALKVANILPTDIDMVIVATSTPENIFPSTASLIQDSLGATSAGAFDLSAACTGFIYGLDIATNAILAGSIKTALVIGSETMSRLINWEDRGTCILFGDGAGAVILQARPTPGGILSSILRSDGSGRDLLTAPTVGSRDAHIPEAGLAADSVVMHRMTMNGREVFRFASRVIRESVLEALEKADCTIEAVDWVIPHQANARIISRAAKSLNIPEDKFIVNIEQYGNTSAASIPIALCEAIEQDRIKANDTLVFVGFGAGLAWGATVITWGVTEPVEQSYLNEMRRELAYRVARQRSRLTRTLRRVEGWRQDTPLDDL